MDLWGLLPGQEKGGDSRCACQTINPFPRLRGKPFPERASQEQALSFRKRAKKSCPSSGNSHQKFQAAFPGAANGKGATQKWIHSEAGSQHDELTRLNPGKGILRLKGKNKKVFREFLLFR